MGEAHESGRPVALVTGGARGIGRGIAVALASAGFDLAINDRHGSDADAADALAEIAGGRAKAIYAPADIADLGAHQKLLDVVLGVFGRIDCLVNNAGVSVLNRGDLLDASIESYDRCLDTNLRGPFILTQRVARHMTAAPPPATHRSILFIGSISSEVVSINRGEYCISKAGISMMAKLFAVRLAGDGIGVYEIRPGIIRTAMTAPSAARFDKLFADNYQPISRWGEPAEVGQAAVALATGWLPFSVGQVVHVDGGLNLRIL